MSLQNLKKDVPHRHILFHMSLFSLRNVRFISPSLALLEPL